MTCSAILNNQVKTDKNIFVCTKNIGAFQLNLSSKGLFILLKRIICLIKKQTPIILIKFIFHERNF